MDDTYKMVDFETYCQKCKYWSTDETEGPCNECLEHPTRLYSSKPEKFESKQ